MRMRKWFWSIVTAVCTSLIGMISVCAQNEDQGLRAARAYSIMETVQTVSLCILVVAIVLLLMWYIAKAIFKHMQVPSEQKEEKSDENNHDQ